MQPRRTLFRDCLLALCIISACNAVFAQQLRTCMLDMSRCCSCRQLGSTPSAGPQQQLPQQLQGRLSGLQPPALLPSLHGADDSTALACMHCFYSPSSTLVQMPMSNVQSHVKTEAGRHQSVLPLQLDFQLTTRGSRHECKPAWKFVFFLSRHHVNDGQVKTH
jgi:hypothetical protein